MCIRRLHFFRAFFQMSTFLVDFHCNRNELFLVFLYDNLWIKLSAILASQGFSVHSSPVYVRERRPLASKDDSLLSLFFSLLDIVNMFAGFSKLVQFSLFLSTFCYRNSVIVFFFTTITHGRPTTSEKRAPHVIVYLSHTFWQGL
jgi:hypothetical protein